MKVVAGYLLAVLGGNENPSSEDVARILRAGGVQVDQADVERLLLNLRDQDQDLDSVIARGKAMIVSRRDAEGPQSQGPADADPEADGCSDDCCDGSCYEPEGFSLFD
jgi:ribosomal protein L12E/L44/L45/RPP1/RPP2